MENDILISPDAQADLVSIFEYILKKKNIEQAEKCIQDLEKTIFSLRSLAERGKYPPELLSQNVTVFREIQCYPWRIFYRIMAKEVWILAVLDGRRHIAGILPERFARLT